MRKNAKKLVLTKETLRTLEVSHLEQVAAGYSQDTHCSISCGPSQETCDGICGPRVTE